MKYQNTFHKSYFSTDICAGDDGKGICRWGDYGGSLIVQENGHYAVVGVISWGYRCAEPGFPGIYARVTARLDWILANTQGTQDTSCATSTTEDNTSAINTIITIIQNTTQRVEREKMKLEMAARLITVVIDFRGKVHLR